MKKIVLVVVVIAIGVAAYFVFTHAPVPMQNAPATNVTSSSTATAGNQQNPIPVLPKFTTGKAPEDLSSVKNASTGVVVSFKFIPTDAPNSGAGVYVGKQKIGEIGGFDISMIGFSPDNNYFALEWKGVSGADRKSYGVNVADIKNKKMIRLKTSIQSPPYANAQYKDIDLDSYIDSVVWSSDHALDIRSYYLWPDFNDASQTIAYYRVSPEETWQYDLATGSSTLINTIP